ncbi:MAG: T9SS type A sorting domain-containing protein [Agriterribacter sp.]
MKLTMFFLLLAPLAVRAQSPGGVSTNLILWNRADSGLTLSGTAVTGWGDLTETNTFSVAGTGSPQFMQSVVNYNPSIIMNGSSHFAGNSSLTNMTHVFAVGYIENAGGVESGALIGLTSDGNKYFFHTRGLPRRFLCGDGTKFVNAGGLPSNTIPYSVLTEDLGKTPAANDRIRINGRPITNRENDPAPFSGVPTLGSRANFNMRNTSALVELIVFSASLSDADESKIESYLAIKYGMTLEHNYLNSAGATIYNASGRHNQNIIGIGRDDNSDLYQKQSHTGNDFVRVYINSLASSNKDNSGTFDADNSFLVLGDNGWGVYFNAENLGRPSDPNILSRLNREWKITNTGFSGSFSMQMRIFPPDPDPARVRVLVDDDGNFKNGGTAIYAPTIDYSEGRITVSGITTSMIPENSTRYITLAYMAAPGNVGNSLTFWLKADAGITATGGQVEQWDDQALNKLHVAQTETARRPGIDADTINYYPVVSFDGSNDVLSRNVGAGYNLLLNAEGGTSSNTTGSIFSVAKFGSDITNGTVFSQLPDPACGVPVVFSGLSSGNLQIGGRSRLSGTIAVADPAKAFIASGLEAPGANNAMHYLNGGNGQAATNASAEVCTSNQTIQTGAGLNGSVAEVITYNVLLTNAQRRQIESYLAIKYGITMNAAGGGTLGNYVSSGNVTLWDASVNSSYHNNVIGIGRDDSTALLQKQTHQADDSTRLYLSALAGTNMLNTGAVSNNGAFVMMGNNQGRLSGTEATSNEVPTSILVIDRLAREWKVTNTAFNETFNLDVRLDNTGLGIINAANLALLVDGDGDFTNADVYTSTDGLSFTYAENEKLISVSGISTIMIPANSTRYITIAKIAATPAGVTGVRVWAKADAGVYADFGTQSAMAGDGVAQWNDFSGNNIHLYQRTASERPIFISGDTIAFNYNPAIKFTNSYLKTELSDGLFRNGVDYNDIHIYTVHHDLDDSNFDWLYYEGSGGFTNRVSASLNFSSNKRADYDITTSNRVSASTINEMPTGVTNIVGHHMGTGGNYGQANNRHGALMVNGKEAGFLSAFSGYTPTSTSDFYLGDNETGNTDNPNEPFTGYVGEVLLYVNALTGDQRNQVESYLAIKYGKTLSSSAGGTDGDYLSSTAITVWDASAGSAYHNQVIGIGRDDNAALSQRQSHTADDSTRIYLDTLQSTNAANNGSFNRDVSFVLIGNNQGTLSETDAANVEVPASSLVNGRLEREWKITNTAVNESFSIDIRLNEAGLGSINISNLGLLVDTDGDFTNADIYTLTDGLSFIYSESENLISVSGISTRIIPVNSTRYITLARVAVTPGGVAGVRLWTKADAGVYSDFGVTPAGNDEAVGQWSDFSGNNIHLFQSVANRKPVLLNGSSLQFNYNPALYFTNSDLVSAVGDGVFANGQTYNDVSIYTVHHDLDAGNFDWLYYEGGSSASNRVAAGYNFSTTSGFHQVTTTYSLNASTIDEIPVGRTNIVGFNAGMGGNYGHAGDRSLALTVNGKEVNSSTSSFPGYLVANTSEFFLGDNETGNTDNGNNPFGGYIGELLVYVSPLSAMQRSQIESYFAIKYGKTLDNSDGGIFGDYVSSTGTTVWDASEGSSYHNNVIGIARDNASGLLQKQSHQTDDSTRLYLSALASTNILNTGRLSDNRAFVMMGNNQGKLSETTAANSEVPMSVVVNARLEREWKVTNTAFNETFNLDVRLGDNGLGSINAANLALLVDGDGDFTNAEAYTSADGLSFTYAENEKLISVSGISTAMIPANSTRYITIAKIVVTPGGVADVRVWIKADAGVYNDFGTVPASNRELVAQWNDFSSNNIHFFQRTASERPAFVSNGANAFNYNPAIRFTNSYLKTELLDGVFGNGQTYNDIHIYSVYHDLDDDDFDWLYYEGSGSNRVSGSFNFSSGTRVDYDITTANRISASSASELPAGVTNIVGHHMGTSGNYGQADNRYGALMVNGQEVAALSGFSGYTPLSTSDFYLGDNETGNNDSPDNPFTGYVGEMLLYVNSLTKNQRNQVESYLAIKYGKTLDNSAGETDGDYLSSAGTAVWDASVGSDYHNQVIGIARDDNASLSQRQSHTADDTTRIYLSTLQTTNAANNGSFGNDNSFVMAGNNEGEMFSTGSTEYPPGEDIFSRLDREWKITNTNFASTFSMDFTPKFTDVTAADIRLLVDDDGDFSNATVYTPSVAYNNGVISVSGINTTMIPANNTRYITLASVNQRTSLPILLAVFTARPQGATVLLNWTTSTEQNNALFAIERSADGVEWQQIAEVKGAGNSSQPINYSYTDIDPLDGTSYYRLKQIDNDGTYSYSPIEQVRRQANNAGLRIYPNPAGNEVIVEGSRDDVKSLRVFDLLGRDITPELQISSHNDNRTIVNLTSMPNGVYIFRVKDVPYKVLKK